MNGRNMEREIITVVRRIAEELARGDYVAVVTRATVSRLTADDLRTAITDYGRTLVPAPDSAYDSLDLVRVRRPVPTWSVRAPLWTKEEGRSDLTLELTVVAVAGATKFELDDLHVA